MANLNLKGSTFFLRHLATPPGPVERMDTRSTKRTVDEIPERVQQEHEKSLSEIYLIMEKQMDLMTGQRKLQQEQDERLQEKLGVFECRLNRMI